MKFNYPNLNREERILLYLIHKAGPEGLCVCCAKWEAVAASLRKKGYTKKGGSRLCYCPPTFFAATTSRKSIKFDLGSTTATTTD